jgi:hypothetical protein
MAEPTLYFGYSHSNEIDTPWGWDGIGEPVVNGWKLMDIQDSLLVFTGGGILGELPVPTVASGTRDATIRPSAAPYIIPQTYVEQGDTMYICCMAGHNINRFALGVYVEGTCTSDLYLEAWDDHTFATTELEVLSGTANTNNMSFINAIRTTYNPPPWHPGWSGIDAEGAYLRGTTHRIGLNNSSSVTNKTLYFNIYIKLPTDVSTFHATPVLAMRYLYT